MTDENKQNVLLVGEKYSVVLKFDVLTESDLTRQIYHYLDNELKLLPAYYKAYCDDYHMYIEISVTILKSLYHQKIVPNLIDRICEHAED